MARRDNAPKKKKTKRSLPQNIQELVNKAKGSPRDAWIKAMERLQKRIEKVEKQDNAKVDIEQLPQRVKEFILYGVVPKRVLRKYIKEVTGDYSYAVKYYLASQMELDRAVEQLIKNLEASGELDNTVIALVGDHYPYTLSTDEVNEVSTYTKDGVVGVNKSNFIIWNNQMEEPIVVDKLGSQIDVLPTLLNLFGIEYDSRLIIGKDILSNGECLAIFSNYSWVSDYGTYYANKKKFVPKEGTTLEDQTAYVTAINNRVSNYYSISKLIMDNDYYNYILGSE